MSSVSDHGRKNLMDLFQFAYLDNKSGSVSEKQIIPYLNAYTTLRVVEKGEDIIRPMDLLRSIIMIVKGKAYFIRVSAKGDMNMLAATSAPMFIGVTQMFSSDKTYYSQILAAERCVIVDIDCNYFLRELRRDGNAAMVIIDSLSKIVERNHERMDRMVFLSSHDNFVAYICRKWLENGELCGKGEPLYIRERHGVIATDIGISVRTLYRAINKLKEENLITILKGGIMMFTVEQLDEIRRRHENM